MRVLLVVNPVATGLTPALSGLAERRLRRVATSLQVVRTERAGHARELACAVAAAARDRAPASCGPDGPRDAADPGGAPGTTAAGPAAGTGGADVVEPVDAVVVVGGDGTLNEVVDGLLERGVGAAPGVCVGVVAAGSANVFARAVGLPGRAGPAVDAVAEAVEAGRTRPVGLATVVLDDAAPRWLTFGVSLGLDAEIVARVEGLRARGRRATPARYVRAGFAQHLRTDRRRPRLRLVVEDADGRVTSRAAGLFQVLVASTSPWTYLGERPVDLLPGTRPQDGLGVFGLRTLALLPVLRVGLAGLVGRFDPGPPHVVRHLDAAAVEVRADVPVAVQVDGDHAGAHQRARVVRVPDALRVLVRPSGADGGLPR